MLNELNEEGLFGPPDGLRAMSYEFCIPNKPQYISEIKTIDPAVQIQHAPGRVGCNDSELLCTGHTANKDYLLILATLADKQYIKVIKESWLE